MNGDLAGTRDSTQATFTFGRDALSPGVRYDPGVGGRLTIYSLASGRAQVEVEGRVQDIPAGYSLIVLSSQRHVYLPYSGSGHVVSWCESTAPEWPVWPEPDIALLRRPFVTSERARALHALGEQVEMRLNPRAGELARHLGLALVSEFLST